MSALHQAAVVLMLLGLSVRPTPAVRAAERGGSPPGQQVRAYGVDIGLVRLSVAARTTKGDLVHDLKPEEFEVLEEGMRQEVVRFGHHEAPISVVVLFDKSASMRDEKLMHAKDGALNFVRALRAQDEVLIVAFSEAVDVLGPFGLDPRALERATKNIRAESGTRLYDAVLEGAQALASPGRKEKRALLILSDGEDTASAATLEETVEGARRAGVPFYAIGIEMDEEDPGPSFAPPGSQRGPEDGSRLGFDPPGKRLAPRPVRKPRTGPSQAIRALTRLTEGTGGWTYRIVAARRCKEVCLRVAEELRNQYLLGYLPSDGVRDGRWRTVVVRTSRPGVTLTTRAGYYAASP